MKKILILVLAGALLLLCACGGRGNNVDPGYEPAAVTPSPIPTAVPTPTPEPTPEPPDESLLPGTRDVNTYTNEYFGIGCRLDGSWTFYTQAQIDELTQMAAQSLAGDEASLELSQLGEDGFYCLVAESGSRNVNMTVQKLPEGADAASAAQEAASGLVDVLLSMGLNNLSVVSDETIFAGRKVPRLTATGAVGEVSFSAKIVVYEAYGRIAVVTASGQTAEEAQEILDAWYALE